MPLPLRFGSSGLQDNQRKKILVYVNHFRLYGVLYWNMSSGCFIESDEWNFNGPVEGRKVDAGKLWGKGGSDRSGINLEIGVRQADLRKTNGHAK